MKAPSVKTILIMLAISFPLLILLEVFILTLDPALPLYSRNENRFAFNPYSDNPAGGRSTIDHFEINEDSVVLAYTLRKGIDSPFAGINCLIKAHEAFIDLRPYESIDLEIGSEHDVMIKILIRFFIDGYSNINNFWSFGMMEQELFLKAKRKHYTIPIKKFSVPEWWYKQTSRENLPEAFAASLSKVSDFNIDASIFTGSEQEERLTLYGIAAQRSRTVALSAAILIFAAYAASFLLLLIRARLKKEKTPELDRVHVELARKKDEDLSRITDLIGRLYHDQKIGTIRIYAETGINPRRINALVREKYGYNITRLINSVRIEEAKRLLVETDRQVLEIALAVGFSNAVHFNRVFRELTKVTPKEFRSKS
jgi:AraC-like DNA-binding protein